MNQPPFGETPQQRATYLKWAFNDDLNQCLIHCDKMISADITPTFFEKVKAYLESL